jgi:hypothetical protein
VQQFACGDVGRDLRSQRARDEWLPDLLMR